jgi:hypothetical protein
MAGTVAMLAYAGSQLYDFADELLTFHTFEVFIHPGIPSLKLVPGSLPNERLGAERPATHRQMEMGRRLIRWSAPAPS